MHGLHCLYKDVLFVHFISNLPLFVDAVAVVSSLLVDLVVVLLDKSVEAMVVLAVVLSGIVITAAIDKKHT